MFLILIFHSYGFSDAVKIQTKFKQVSQNEMEDVIKYILAQAPFNIKRQNEKNVLTL